MFNCGINEKALAENSGHRSTKAPRSYKTTSEVLQQAVTKVINNPTNPATPKYTAFTFQHSSQSTSVTKFKEIVRTSQSLLTLVLAANPSFTAMHNIIVNVCTCCVYLYVYLYLLITSLINIYVYYDDYVARLLCT